MSYPQNPSPYGEVYHPEMNYHYTSMGQPYGFPPSTNQMEEYRI